MHIYNDTHASCAVTHTNYPFQGMCICRWLQSLKNTSLLKHHYVCLHVYSHPTQRLCQLLREREIWGMHRDINATPCMCVSVYVCQGGVRRQLRFHIAPRKRLELEACYNAKYTHTCTCTREYTATQDRQWKWTDNMMCMLYCF